jgi:hypothetical protein
MQYLKMPFPKNRNYHHREQQEIISFELQSPRSAKALQFSQRTPYSTHHAKRSVHRDITRKTARKGTRGAKMMKE